MITVQDCPSCFGTGKVPGMEEGICSRCNGTGKIPVVQYPPDTNPYQINN
jgi:DnaJ-class molecular chaperone